MVALIKNLMTYCFGKISKFAFTIEFREALPDGFEMASDHAPRILLELIWNWQLLLPKAVKLLF